MTLTPTDEQSDIVQAVARQPDSLMIPAYAGCAKSSTLAMSARGVHMPALYMVFNKSAALEAKEKFPGNFTISTANALGHRAWGRAVDRKLELDDKKLGKLVSEVAKDYKLDLSGDQWAGLRQLAQAAMTSGLVPSGSGPEGLVPDSEDTWAALADDCWLDESDSELLAPLAREVLIRDIALAREGKISFDDQVYCSALLGGVFPKFPVVFLDEAQDLAPLNLAMLGHIAIHRLVAVGDQKQAIYGFRGALHDSMERVGELRQTWTRLPLTMTFRCPKQVVSRQQAHAPGYRAAMANREGRVTRWIEFDSEGEPKPWSWRQVAAVIPPGGKPVILCRNNAPLLGMAFALIRQGIGVTMLGRDIGKNLVVLSRKIAKEDAIPADVVRGLVQDWRESEASLAKANDHEERVAGINDRADCLLAVLSRTECRDAGQLRAMLEQLFSRTDGLVTLSSIHRAKGLEWDLVLHLDPWRVPSKWAKRPGHEAELQQELNLKYVCETRTRDVLVEANLEDFT